MTVQAGENIDIGVTTSPIGNWAVPPEYNDCLRSGREPFYIGVSGTYIRVHGVSAGTGIFGGYYVVNGKKYVDSITVTVEE